MALPFAPTLSRLLVECAEKADLQASTIESYVITEGPRFESCSEVKLFKKIGAEAVCFSGIPDVYFARELGINLACGFFVSNLAEGLSGDGFDDILGTCHDQAMQIYDLMVKLFNSDIKKTTDQNYHQAYWMQKPGCDIHQKIINSM